MPGFVTTEAVLYRFVTLNDFKSLNGLHTGGSGGGARHLELGNFQPVHLFFELRGKIEQECGPFDDDEVFDVLSEECEESDRDSIQFSITIESVGDEVGEIEFSLRYQEVRNAWQIGNLNENRYSLWTEDYGFTALDDFNDPNNPTEEEYYEQISPTIIYFVKDMHGDYHSRALYEATQENIERFPEPLASTWLDLVNRSVSQIQAGNNTGMVAFTNHE